MELNNRQLTHTEKERIKKLANGDADKEARLTAAACAAVKCYAEYPKDSASYFFFERLAQLGDSPDLAPERLELAEQQGLYAYSTDGVLSDKNVDAARRFNNTYQLTDRTLGLLQGVLGTAGAAASATGCLTPVTCAAALTSMGINLDYANAGFFTTLTGQQQAALGEQALIALGMSKEAASIAYAAMGLSPVAIQTLLSTKAANQAAASYNAAKGSYTSANIVGAKGVGELSFGANGRKLDFLFNRKIDQSNAYNALRAEGNASKIGIADTAANRAEVTSLFNEAYNNPATIIGSGKLPGSNVREFLLPGVTGTGSKIQFVEQNGKVITIMAK